MFKHRILWLVLLTVLIGFSAYSQTPFTFTQAGVHPRIMMTPARISRIQSALANYPLNGQNFPAGVGSLQFDLYPVPSTGQNYYDAIFDAWDSTRNHFFIRHNDSGAPQGQCPLQIAFQQAGNNNYTASYNLSSLSCNAWHTVVLMWNSSTPSVSLQVDGGSPASFNMSGWPNGFSPNQENFGFYGHGDQIDNMIVYNSDPPAQGNELINVPFSEGSGNFAASAVGSDKLHLVNAAWVARSPGYAIELTTTPQSAARVSSAVAEIWPSFYSNALYYAKTLNSGGMVVSDLVNNGQDAVVPAQDLGLAWLVTGDPQFQSAMEIFADQITATPYNGSNDWSEAGRVQAMGFLYDDLFDSNPSVLSSLAAAIEGTVPYLSGFVCGYDSNGNSIAFSNPGGGVWTCSTHAASGPFWSGGHADYDDMQIAAAAFAVYDEHPELADLLTTLYNDILANLQLKAWVSEDGGHHFCFSYGATYNQLYGVQIWNDVTATPFFAPWQGNLINRFIYGLRGNMSFPACGDDFQISPAQDQIIHFALTASNLFGNGYAQDFYNNWISPAVNWGGGHFTDLLFAVDNAPTSPISNLPYSANYRNAGNVLMRDSWDFPNAALLEFRSASFDMQNHKHFAENAFSLYYKAPQIVHSGYYDSYGTSHWWNYYIRSIATNTITVYDPNEQFQSYGGYCPNNLCSNDGGQTFQTINYPSLAQMQTPISKGGTQLGGVTQFEYDNTFSYAVGNASQAYGDSKLDPTNGFVRSIVFLRTSSFWSKPITVVFDKVLAQAAKAGLVKKFVLHTVNEPLAPGTNPVGATSATPISGNTFSATNGAGMTFVTSLLPKSAVINKIGGESGSSDYRFWVANSSGVMTNYPPQSQPPASFEDAQAAWRVEINAPSPSQQEYFLNAIAIADAGTVQGPSIVSASSSNAAVAYLGGKTAVAFALSNTPASSMSWTLPSTKNLVIITGLIPSTRYSLIVSKSGSQYLYSIKKSQTGALTSSAQGVISTQK